MALLALPLLKIASVLILAVAIAAIAAQSAVADSIAAAAPVLWSYLRFFLVPPYLFITVHLIIAAIWKLSDRNTAPKNPADDRFDAVKEASVNATPVKSVPVEVSAGSPISDSKSAESCVTAAELEEEEEDAAVESREEEGGLEDTWQGIVMRRSAAWQGTSESVAEEGDVRRSATFTESSPAVEEESDDINQRFEEFIRRSKDQMRSY